MPTTFLNNPVSINVSSSAQSLSVAGTPAAPTVGSGAQPSDTLSVQGTNGQDTTGTGQTAGAGANVTITAGTGGAAPTGSTNGTGGCVTINPGSPGAGAGTAATLGSVLLATAGGNVGIGTGSPSQLLTLCHTSSPVLRFDRSAIGAYDWEIYTGPTGILSFRGGADGSGISLKDFLTFSGTGTPTFAKTISSGTSGGGSGFDGGFLAYQAGGTQSILINSVGSSYLNGGNVGVGTTTPGSKLHVNGGVLVGTPTGGDMGTGNINVSGDIYKNGTPQLKKLEQAYREIIALTKRVDRLAAELARKSSKAGQAGKSDKAGKPRKSVKSAKSHKERR